MQRWRMNPNDDSKYWAGDAEDTTPYIKGSSCLKHRLKEGKDINEEFLGRDDFEYYIKWQGKSLYHATWETDNFLNGHARGGLETIIKRCS